MKTLVLLSALVLLAFQVQADPIQGTGEQTKSEKQPGDEQRVFFEDLEGSPIQDADVKSGLTCYCRLTGCGFGERLSGTCRYQGRIFRLCCR
ncbi:alpha-defensin 23-like [Mastomys coucha]|uniref:alpha-defensin 23-like n=1 Tax=Mastomys coucha TaxID=35658 RepID=UPI0012616D38|nr:alpha-defensin 23-like [Mastomys coucha]